MLTPRDVARSIFRTDGHSLMPRQCIQELACEFGGIHAVTRMAAGQFDYFTAQFPAEFHVDFGTGQTARVPPNRQHDPFGVRLKRFEFEVDCRVLAQLMFKPVRGIGADLFILQTHCARHELPVRLGEGVLTKLHQGELHPGLQVEVMDAGEKVEPLLPISQLPYCWWLEWHQRAHHGWMASEEFQHNDASGAGAENGCGFVAHMFDELSKVVRVCRQPMLEILRADEVAA